VREETDTHLIFINVQARSGLEKGGVQVHSVLDRESHMSKGREKREGDTYGRITKISFKDINVSKNRFF
jgi:hypothetical protein